MKMITIMQRRLKSCGTCIMHKVLVCLVLKSRALLLSYFFLHSFSLSLSHSQKSQTEVKVSVTYYAVYFFLTRFLFFALALSEKEPYREQHDV